MIVISNIMTTEDISNRQLKRALRKLYQKTLKGYFFVVVRNEGQNLIEVFNHRELYYRNEKEEIYVVGLMKNREQTKVFIQEIIENIVSENLSINSEGIKKYFGITENK